MKIKYKRSVQFVHIIMALLFIIIFIVQLEKATEYSSRLWGYLFLVFIYCYYLYRIIHFGYLEISDGKCTQYNFLTKKTIDLNEVISFKYFAKNYILHSSKADLHINEKLIDPKLISNFLEELKRHNITLNNE